MFNHNICPVGGGSFLPSIRHQVDPTCCRARWASPTQLPLGRLRALPPGPAQSLRIKMRRGPGSLIAGGSPALPVALPATCGGRGRVAEMCDRPGWRVIILSGAHCLPTGPQQEPPTAICQQPTQSQRHQQPVAAPCLIDFDPLHDALRLLWGFWGPSSRPWSGAPPYRCWWGSSPA